MLRCNSEQGGQHGDPGAQWSGYLWGARASSVHVYTLALAATGMAKGAVDRQANFVNKGMVPGKTMGAGTRTGSHRC